MVEEDETRKKSGKMPNFAEYERQRILDAAAAARKAVLQQKNGAIDDNKAKEISNGRKRQRLNDSEHKRVQRNIQSNGYRHFNGN